MTECFRCQRDATQQMMDGTSICEDCADWLEEHEQSREAGQQGLEDML